MSLKDEMNERALWVAHYVINDSMAITEAMNEVFSADDWKEYNELSQEEIEQFIEQVKATVKKMQND